MDTRLVFVAAIASIGLARPALADTAADYLKRGAELYKAGKYSEAVLELTKAYELDPSPVTLFPLAQSERLSGDCKAAAAHYRKLLTMVSDLTVARAVQENLELCEPPTEAKAPTCPAPAPPPVTKSEPPPPITVTRVVERERTDYVTAGLVGGGALAMGVAVGLYFAASSSRDAADRADSLDSHDEIAARADRQRIGAIVAAGLGTAALSVAGVRWVLRRKNETSAEVAVIPASDGVGVWATGRF